MDETLIATGSAEGNNDRELTHDFLFNITGSNSDDESDLNIDSTRGSSEHDSYTSSRSYTSPRALILASKSSEEDLVVPQSMVKERHKWIERTLLNVKDDTVVAPVISKSNARGEVMKRHRSLPANTISTPPSGSSDDVITRVLVTAEARKQSREGARAKVQADISALAGDIGLVEEEEKRDQVSHWKDSGVEECAEVSDLRARAQVKLNSAMELLAFTSSRNTQRNSPLNRVDPKADGSCKMQEDEIKYEIPMDVIDIKCDETSKYDADSREDPVQQSMTVLEQSKRDLFAVEDEAQGEFEHQKEAGSMPCTRQHDDVEELDVSVMQIGAKMASKNELTTDLTEIIQKEKGPEEEIARLEEEIQQSVQKRLEQDRLTKAAANQDEHINDEECNGQAQASFGCDLGVNNSSSSSDIIASLLENPSDTSDASLPSQVDEILYQGKVKNVLKEEGLHTNDSTENEYDDVDIENGYYSSASQSSDVDPSIDYTDLAIPADVHSPGPMWRNAAEQASTSTAETRLDALDPSVTSQYDPYTRQEHNHSLRVANKTTEYETELFTEWNGFNRERMICMVVIGVFAGLLPSLYAQWTCHFVTGDIIDDDESAFLLNFGLQEFTPIDSSFQGYDYCLDYDSKYNYNPPLVPRFAGIAATIFGSISLLVIGVHLLFSTTNKILWHLSMWMLYFGSICQISTLSIFLLDLCQDGITCSMGPGAWSTVVSSLAWFALSIEMKLNSALAHPVKSQGVVVIERESTFTSWIKKYWNSAIGEPSLSRTAMKMQKRVRKGGSEPGRYKPPVVI